MRKSGCRHYSKMKVILLESQNEGYLPYFQELYLHVDLNLKNGFYLLSLKL